MEATRPNFSVEDKRSPVELWKAKVPLAQIRAQLKMSGSKLRCILKLAKANPSLPVMVNQYLKNLVKSMMRRLEAVIANQGNPTKYKPVA